jgi:GTPase SAR1 family protein
VTALIYVASLTEYDEVLFEDKSKNRLQESLEVWEDLVNSTFFLNVPILLFLNKLDLFEDKYVRRKIPLNVTGLFPDAPSGEPDMKVAIDWITEQFRSRRTKSDPALLFVHTIAAVDANQVDTVFRDVKEIAVLRAMGQQGLV